MVFFSIIGVSVSIYYLVRVFLWIVLDCDIELFIKLWRGEPICNAIKCLLFLTCGIDIDM